MPFNIGPFELLLVLVLVLLIIGPGKLPEVGSAIGKTIREFRKASTDVQESLSVDPAKPVAAAPASTAAPATPAADASTEVREDVAAS
jgi:sec-independent protein translocase protein TatA